jgi:hypothetical protein
MRAAFPSTVTFSRDSPDSLVAFVAGTPALADFDEVSMVFASLDDFLLQLPSVTPKAQQTT